MNTTDNSVLLECTTSIVSAYVSNNTIQKENLSALIAETFRSLSQVDRTAAPIEDLKPAVPVKRSVQPDHIVCLEDGKKFKSLKRHLMSHYNMTPQDYREKWGLPVDYPMVAPNYALALGQRQKPAAAAEKAPAKARKKAPAAKKGASRKTAAAAAV
jgi:predicted transcriptional regulator